MQLAEPILDDERQQRAREYDRLTRRLSIVELVIVGLVLLVLIFGGLSARMSQFLTYPQPWASSLYFVVLMLGLGIITLPFTYYQGFVLPHRYGLSNQKVGDWLADGAKAAALGVVLGVAIVIAVYLLLERLPGAWWLWASILLWLFSLLLTRLTPTLLLPLFFSLKPLADEDLKQRLTNLAEKAHSQVRDIFTMDLSSKSTAANAMLAGLGDTRRIILSDTLLQKYTPEEIEVILAHELGHHLHRDIPKLIAVQGIIFLVAFYLANLALKAGVIPLGFRDIVDVAAFPLLFSVLAAFTMVISPLANFYNRHLEALADKTALELTANPGAFVSAMAKLANQNLSVAAPSRLVEILFYDHPPYVRRVDLARHYTQKIS